MYQFTYTRLKKSYEAALENGYEIISCEEFALRKKNKQELDKLLVNRLDIDFSVKRLAPLLDVYKDLNIKASIFVRLHADDYNPFSFDNYRVLKKAISDGHEIGYHSEIIDQSHIWNEDAEACLLRDIDTLNRMFNIKITGIASHGGLTGWNNLDFWQNKTAKDFGLLYEAYDKEPEFNLFYESHYISDSVHPYWKAYENGIIMSGDNRTLDEHIIEDQPSVIYLLLHPGFMFNEHVYEL